MSSSEAIWISTLPPSNSTELCLTRPTEEEALHVLKVNSEPWKGPLSIEAYVRRERLLGTVLHSARDGSKPWELSSDLSGWILTTTYDPPNARPILASCETVRKRALVAFDAAESSRGRVVKEILCVGIASVFCEEQFRRRGYAGRMMTELSNLKKARQVNVEPECMFSVLFSDIGKVSIRKNCRRGNVEELS